MLLIHILYNLIKATEKASIDRVMGCLVDTLTLLRDTNKSEDDTETKTKKMIDIASENLEMLFSLMGDEEDDSDLEEALVYFTKTDKDIREKYKTMTLNDLENKVIDLERLFENGRKKLIEKFRSMDQIPEHDSDEAKGIQWKKSEMGIEEDLDESEDFYTTEEVYDILNKYKEDIYYYTTLIYYKFIGETNDKGMCESCQQKADQDLVKN